MSDKIYDLREGYVPSHLRANESRQEPQAAPRSPVQVINDPGYVPEWVKQRRGTPGVKKYPFETMPVNGTFQIPPGPEQPKWRSIRVYCSNKGTELGKKFRCHRYPDGTFEVWRER